MRIDCTQCEMYESEHCQDCLVTAVLHPPAGPVDIDQDLDPPLQELAGAGLIPVLKFRPRPRGSQNERGVASAGPQNERGEPHRQAN
jgi:hypothetical protein